MPGLPLGLFEVMALALGTRDATTGGLPGVVTGVELVVDEHRSGPEADGADPFTTGAADLGVMCAPPYLELRSSATSPPVELLGVAPVFDDPRAAGQPVYFADVVVRDDHPARILDELAGVRFGYNDPSSLSGLLALRWHLGDRFGLFAASAAVTGSHDASLTALIEGSIDVASIDSNTLRLRRVHGDPAALGVRVVASLGPHPIQPVVVRTSLEPEIRSHALLALSRLGEDASSKAALRQWGCLGTAPVDESHYTALARRLARHRSGG